MIYDYDIKYYLNYKTHLESWGLFAPDCNTCVQMWCNPYYFASMKILFHPRVGVPWNGEPRQGLPLSRRVSSSRSLARQVSAASSFHGDKVAVQQGVSGTVGNYGCGILGRV